MTGTARRVCLLGAESTGKTTLAAALAKHYDTLWNPEYGRVYSDVGRERGAPWKSWEFAHIAHVHCWYEDFLAPLARRVLFCDTDAFTTKLFHQVYLDAPTAAFDDLAARSYDLYLVCGIDVPWRHDGVREFDAQREWMHERYLERAQESGSPWLLLEGPHEARLAASCASIDLLLGR